MAGGAIRGGFAVNWRAGSNLISSFSCPGSLTLAPERMSLAAELVGGAWEASMGGLRSYQRRPAVDWRAGSNLISLFSCPGSLTLAADGSRQEGPRVVAVRSTTSPSRETHAPLLFCTRALRARAAHGSRGDTRSFERADRADMSADPCVACNACMRICCRNVERGSNRSEAQVMVARLDRRERRASRAEPEKDLSCPYALPLPSATCSSSISSCLNVCELSWRV